VCGPWPSPRSPLVRGVSSVLTLPSSDLRINVTWVCTATRGGWGGRVTGVCVCGCGLVGGAVTPPFTAARRAPAAQGLGGGAQDGPPSLTLGRFTEVGGWRVVKIQARFPEFFHEEAISLEIVFDSANAWLRAGSFPLRHASCCLFRSC
jgi:hypothetical protein